LSSGPTDRAGRRLLAGLAVAALALLPGPPPAAADGPVFFRNPDPATAKDIAVAMKLFGDPSPNIRERARDQLHDIGWWSVSRLLDTIRERQGQFRTNAYLVLGRLGDPRAIPAMRAEVAESSEWPPSVAALMLGRLRDSADPTMEAFAAALRPDAENHLRRRAVCLALAKLHRRRPEECVRLIEQVLDARSANPAVHHAALLSLGFFRSRIVEALPDGSGFQPSRRIQRALADRDSGMRLSALLAMSVSYINSFHPIFVKAFEEEGDHQVRLVALLALGRDRQDPATTALLARVLDNPTANGEERRMAAYLLGRRPDLLPGDAKAMDALFRAASGPRAQEVAATALVALAGVDDERAADLVVSKVGAASATVRAAAAFGSLRLRKEEDLKRAREALAARVKAGETDDDAKFDMKAAIEEIDGILKDRADRAAGVEPKPRPPVKWREADADDLLLVLGRDERQRTFDFVNLRALQVLGIESLFPYRPYYDPDDPAEGLGGQGTKGPSMRPDRPGIGGVFDQYDVRVELSRRPYFTPEQDDPDALPAPVPRAGK
jgi:hypothetical protein